MWSGDEVRRVGFNGPLLWKLNATSRSVKGVEFLNQLTEDSLRFRGFVVRSVIHF
jgi:hypothetical protein